MWTKYYFFAILVMSYKSGNKVLTELLNIKGIKVISKRQHEGINIILHVEQINLYSICPHCKKSSYRLHQNYRYLVKNLPLSGQPVYLEIDDNSSVSYAVNQKREELNFVNKKRTYTSRLAFDILKQVLKSNIKSVAETNHVTIEEIEVVLQKLERW